MKHTALAVIVTVAVAAGSAPASAEGGRNAAAAAIGAIGGFALGNALAAPRPVYVEPTPVYVRPRPAYVERLYDDEECYSRRERVWVPGWGWEVRRRVVCE